MLRISGAVQVTRALVSACVGILEGVAQGRGQTVIDALNGGVHKALGAICDVLLLKTAATHSQAALTSDGQAAAVDACRNSAQDLLHQQLRHMVESGSMPQVALILFVSVLRTFLCNISVSRPSAKRTRRSCVRRPRRRQRRR